ncbi:MAG: DinB family protein [Chitinophagaceae bacterium]
MIRDTRALFDEVDAMMNAFIDSLKDAPLRDIVYELNGVIISGSPLKLFSHVITHEFHHKGQILSLSRHLGYVPVDTDMIR